MYNLFQCTFESSIGKKPRWQFARTECHRNAKDNPNNNDNVTPTGSCEGCTCIEFTEVCAQGTLNKGSFKIGPISGLSVSLTPIME